MARRRKKVGRTYSRTRGRRMGAISLPAVAMTVAYTAVGAVVAKMLQDKVFSKLLESVKLDAKVAPYVNAGLTVAAGVMLPQFLKGTIGMGISSGMVAAGSFKLVESLGIIKGIGLGADTYLIESGADDLSVIAGEHDYAMAGNNDFAMAGFDDVSVIAGFDEDDE